MQWCGHIWDYLPSYTPLTEPSLCTSYFICHHSNIVHSYSIPSFCVYKIPELLCLKQVSMRGLKQINCSCSTKIEFCKDKMILLVRGRAAVSCTHECEYLY